MPSKKANKTNKTKNIVFSTLIAAAIIALVIFAFNGGNNGGDFQLDGTWGHGAETIVFDGDNFVVSGPAGHRHFSNGSGTFEVVGGNIYLTFDDEEIGVESQSFSQSGNSIRIGGHGYSRR